MVSAACILILHTCSILQACCNLRGSNRLASLENPLSVNFKDKDKAKYIKEGRMYFQIDGTSTSFLHLRRSTILYFVTVIHDAALLVSLCARLFVLSVALVKTCADADISSSEADEI